MGVRDVSVRDVSVTEYYYEIGSAILSANNLENFTYRLEEDMFIKLLKRLLYCYCLFALTGCEVERFTKLVPIEGYLHTPNSKYEFKSISKEQFEDYFRNEDYSRQGEAILMANGNGVKVFYCAQKCMQGANFLVTSTKKNAVLRLKANEFNYSSGSIILTDPKSFKNEGGQDLKINLWSKLNSQEPANFYTYFNIPGPDSFVDPQTLNNTHHYHIAFELDGIPCSADFSFTVKYGRRLVPKIGVPGTP